ncbi:hypothetical protein GN244_ATG06359 [Phytophthora infestans]|uniref:Uncharacterized protein n=1 Tax=Phytophthora infestans TaxID=4787 RepID=A0A833WGY3_PHYIN|nr:hypothetical protein GN244_ATG06359 [Phytophthora infestans]KAF4148723.1 hypothetical protein GN958_ATG02079 [Phytophthora infestans]
MNRRSNTYDNGAIVYQTTTSKLIQEMAQRYKEEVSSKIEAAPMYGCV